MTPEANAARWEVVRRLEGAVASPTNELDLSSCDRQACMDLPAAVVRPYAMKCTTSEPPTTELILPKGLSNIPGWMTEFKATLKQVTANDFAGSEQSVRADLELLSWKDCQVGWDLSPDDAGESASPPTTLGIERRLNVQAAPTRTTLSSIYRPYVGELDPTAQAGLKRFMDNVRKAQPFDPRWGVKYNPGGFKIVRSQNGELELSKLRIPPYIDQNLDHDSDDGLGLPKAKQLFSIHSKDVQAAVWQAMSKCGYVDYLTANAEELIDGEWDILVNINPYFGRRPLEVHAHKDTSGENMWLMLFYCNDDADMGIEYQLRQENPPGYLEHMRRQLPSVFVDEVEDILNEPSDGIAYATRIGPWSFIAGCDETMVHSTPFVHHRGAFFLASVLEQFDNALRACFGAHTAEEYSQNVLPASQEVVRQLKGLASSDDCVDRGELEKLLQGAGFTAPSAAKIVETLAPMVRTKDPFDGTAGGLPGFEDIKVPRGKELHREMSDHLDAGTAVRNRQPRDYMRVWIMARRKPE
ncbi:MULTISPECIES: hypothetical protein [unclassified Variovorax]|uniref:hypothetical protein n=1 Tax=unclassified Variovorax TaxID=663243 RepID=UPI000839AAF5|nr:MULTISPECIES: hypothetical protein [unclassified Variovorax]